MSLSITLYAVILCLLRRSRTPTVRSIHANLLPIGSQNHKQFLWLSPSSCIGTLHCTEPRIDPGRPAAIIKDLPGALVTASAIRTRTIRCCSRVFSLGITEPRCVLSERHVQRTLPLQKNYCLGTRLVPTMAAIRCLVVFDFGSIVMIIRGFRASETRRTRPDVF